MCLVVIIGFLILLSSCLWSLLVVPLFYPTAPGLGLWKNLRPRSSKIEAESKLGEVSREGTPASLENSGDRGESFQNTIDVTTERASRGCPSDPITPTDAGSGSVLIVEEDSLRCTTRVHYLERGGEGWSTLYC